MKPLQLQRLFLFNKILELLVLRICNFIRLLEKENKQL